MITSLRRTLRIYGAIAELQPKLSLTYRAWFWSSIVLNTIAMAIYVFFWRAVYASTPSIAGLDMQQTINYILLTQIFLPVADTFLMWEFGYNLREGRIAIELLRPVNMLAYFYTQYLANMLAFLAWNIPMALVATFLFGLRWPTSPATWAVFLVSVFLGRTVLYFFDWIMACITFYTTEVWGLGVLLTRVRPVRQRSPGAAGDDAGLAANHPASPTLRPGRLRPYFLADRNLAHQPGTAPVAGAAGLDRRAGAVFAILFQR